MSSTLVWEPVKRVTNHSLDDSLKWVFQKTNILPKIFDSSDIAYLQGLADAGTSGATDLIEAIEKYERVKVYEEY